MKKVLALILALALTVCCFAGCGKKEASGGKNGEVPTLLWYVPGDQQPALEDVLKEANKIVEKEIGAKIKIQFLDTGAFDEKMRLKMASGEDFDLCFTGYINSFNKAATMGGLEPLDDLLKKTPKLKESLSQSFWDAATVNGKIYAVPNQQIIASYFAPMIPKSLADKYNLDADSIKSYPELEPFLKAVKEGEKGIYPWRNKNAYFKVGMQYEEFFGGFGIRRDGSKKPKVVLIDREQACIDGINLRNDWFKKGYIRPDVLSVTDDTTDYLAGRYAIDIQAYKPGVEINLQNTLGYPVVACKNIEVPYIKQSNVTSTLIGIGRNSKHKEKAIKFIELINTNKELYNLICFGIEGEHYEKIDENTVRVFPNSTYKPEADWKFGNQFNAYIREGSDPEVWEQTKAINDSAESSPLLGFTVDRTKIETEISSCSSVRSQYGKAYFCGAKPADASYDEYLAKMKEAGADKIIAELQKQVDEFIREKNKSK